MSTRFPKLLITLTVALAAMVARPTTAQAQEHADLVWKQLTTAFTTVASPRPGRSTAVALPPATGRTRRPLFVATKASSRYSSTARRSCWRGRAAAGR